MIEWSRVEELRDEIGAEDFEEVVSLFLCEVEERLQILAPDKPVDQSEEDLHFLKGSALNLGFSSLAAICQKGESTASQGQPPTKSELLAVQNCYLESRTEFMRGKC